MYQTRTTQQLTTRKNARLALSSSQTCMKKPTPDAAQVKTLTDALGKMSQDQEMTPDERCRWLRERGVFIETAEERRMKHIRDIMNETDEENETVFFVHVPQDETLPLKELSVDISKDQVGDVLLEHLKPFFQSYSEAFDPSLLKDQSNQLYGNDALPSMLSDESLSKVAVEGHVEVFSLVRPVPSNKFTAINMYLDEIGMLKRLPLNRRAGALAKKAGFDPEPLFYGDVFIGRLASKPCIKNKSFRLTIDWGHSATWLQTAVRENLEYQQAMNHATGTDEGIFQPPAVGTEGKEKKENGFSWTQTCEEVEIIVQLSDSSISSKDLKVKFNPRKVTVVAEGTELLSLELFANIDPDGCTWTIESIKLIISCEKVDAVMWPRVET